MLLLKLMRVKQWIKNVLIFAPLLFSFNLFNRYDIAQTIYTFFSFSFLASFIYIINDILDIEADKLHPVKKNRPIASHSISKSNAYIIAIVLICLSILFSLIVHQYQLYYILLGYLMLNLLYNYKLKNISIIDCISIAIGFELRILAGCVAIGVVASNFILVVTFFLALVLAFLKRKGEIKSLNEHSSLHRKSLKQYTVPLLDKFIYASATITLIGYLFYTIDNHVVEQLGNDYLKYSIVFVLYGLFRFIQLNEIDIYDKEGDPTTLIYKDRGLQLAILCWMVYVTMCLYVF
jgi:decaprenyl-phosphate phosphoribosyltransferase